MGRAARWVGGIVALVATHVACADVSVSNYNWLDLRPESVTTFTNPGGNVGYGEPDDYRWGDHVWIPDATKTGNVANTPGATGLGTYYAGIGMDQGRFITHVAVQVWTGEGTTLSKFTIQGSSDTHTWVDIGSQTYATNPPLRTRTDVDVTDGTYRYLRVVINAGDYTYGSAARGGPGLYAIEPYGNGTVQTYQVNWANKNISGSSVSNNGFPTFNGMRYNDGDLYDDEGTRTGQAGAWDAGDYVQLDLKAAHLIDTSVVVADFIYGPRSYNISYSNDGINFLPVTGKSAAIEYAYNPALNDASPGAAGYNFDPISARYWRITDANGGDGGYNLLNQVLLFNQAPEPGSAGILGMAAGQLILRRRRSPKAL